MEDITKTGPKGLKGLSGLNKKEQIDELIRRDKQFLSQSTPESVLSGYQAGPIENVGIDLMNKGYGDSKYDEDAVTESQIADLNEYRANEQSWLTQVASGLAKGVLLAGTTFLDGTVGLLVGGVEAAKRKDWSGLWDNDFSRAMQSFNDWSEEVLPNYYSKEELEDPWYKHIISSNFIGDKFIKNLGFTVGAFYSGGLEVGAIKGLGKLAMKGALGLEKSIDTVKKIAKTTDHVASVLGAFGSAVNEGRIEALNNSRDWYKVQKQNIDSDYNEKRAVYTALGDYDAVAKLDKDYQETMVELEKDRKMMGNADLAMNIPILMASNLYQFGKLYANGFRTGRRANKIVGNITDGYEKGTTRAAGWRKAIGNALSEGTEEITQKMASNISGDYYQDSLSNFYLSRTDPDAEQKTLSWINSYAQGISETVNEGSSWEEFFIGALTGALGMPSFRSARGANGKWQSPVTLQGGIIGELRENKEQMEREQRVVDYMNKRVQDPKFKEYYQGLIRHGFYQDIMDAAAQEGKEFEFKNAEFAQFLSDVNMFDNAGKLDDLKTIIDSALDTSDKNLESIARNTQSVITREEQVDKLNNDIVELEGIRNSLLSENDAENADRIQSEIDKKKQDIVNAKDKTVSAFVDENGNLTGSLKEKMKDDITNIHKEMNTVMEDYLKTKLDILDSVGENLSDDQLSEMIYLKMQLDNWQQRGTEMAGYVKSTLKELLGPVKGLIGSNNEETSENYKKFYDSLNNLIAMSDEDMMRVLINTSNEGFVDNLMLNIALYGKNIINGLDKSRTIDILDDLKKIGTASELFNRKFEEYIKNPSKQAQRQSEDMQRRQQRKTVTDNIAVADNIRGKSVSDIIQSLDAGETDLNELEAALNDMDDVDEEKGKLNDVKEVLNAHDEASSKLDSQVEGGLISEQEKNDVMSMLNRSRSISENDDEFFDLEGEAFNDLNSIQDNPEEIQALADSGISPQDLRQKAQQIKQERLDKAKAVARQLADEHKSKKEARERLPEGNINDSADKPKPVSTGHDAVNRNEPVNAPKPQDNTLTNTQIAENLLEKNSIPKDKDTLLNDVHTLLRNTDYMLKNGFSEKDLKESLIKSPAWSKVSNHSNLLEDVKKAINDKVKGKQPKVEEKQDNNVEEYIETPIISSDDIDRQIDDSDNYSVGDTRVSKNSEDKYEYWRPVTTEFPIHRRRGDDSPYHEQSNSPEKARYKAIFEFLKSRGVFARRNQGDTVKGNAIYFGFSKELNDKAGVPVILMLNGKGEIIGDLPVPSDANFNDYIGLPEFYAEVTDKLSKGGLNDSGNDIIRIDGYSSSVAQNLGGKPQYTAKSDRNTLNDINVVTQSDGSTKPIPFKIGVALANVTDSGYSGHTVTAEPGRTKKSGRSNLDRSILPPRSSVPGQPYLLMPTNNRTYSYMTVPVTMPMFNINDPKVADSQLGKLIIEKIKELETIGSNQDGLIAWSDGFRELLAFKEVFVDINNNNGVKILTFRVKRTEDTKWTTIYQGEQGKVTDIALQNLSNGNSMFQVSRKYINTTYRGKDYNRIIGELANTNLPVGATHTVNDWFTINPIVKGNQQKAGNIASIKTNPTAVEASTPVAVPQIEGEVAKQLKASSGRIQFNESDHSYTVDGQRVDTSVTQLTHPVSPEEEQYGLLGYFEISSRIGSEVDKILRNYFEGKVYNSPMLTENQNKSVRKHARRLKDSLDIAFGKGWKAITDENMLRVSGTVQTKQGLKTVAGTMDMLIQDSNGTFHIIDFKTRRSESARSIDGSTKNDYDNQVSLYAALLQMNNPLINGKVGASYLAVFNPFYDTPRGSRSNENGNVYYTEENGTIYATNVLDSTKKVRMIDMPSFKAGTFYQLQSVTWNKGISALVKGKIKATNPTSNSATGSNAQSKPSTQSQTQGQTQSGTQSQTKKIGTEKAIELELLKNGEVLEIITNNTNDSNDGGKVTTLQKKVTSLNIKRVLETKKEDESAEDRRTRLHDAVISNTHKTKINVNGLSFLYKLQEKVYSGEISVDDAMDVIEGMFYVNDSDNQSSTEATDSNRKSTVEPLVALQWLLDDGVGTIKSLEYFMFALQGAFPNTNNEIESLIKRNRSVILNNNSSSIQNLNNDDILELRNALTEIIDNYYGEKGIELLNKLINNSTGFLPKVGQQVGNELEELKPLSEQNKGENPSLPTTTEADKTPSGNREDHINTLKQKEALPKSNKARLKAIEKVSDDNLARLALKDKGWLKRKLKEFDSMVTPKMNNEQVNAIVDKLLGSKILNRKAVAEIEEYKNWSIQREVIRVRRMLPQLNRDQRLRFIEGLIKIMDSTDSEFAWGQFQDGIITLSSEAARGTAYHEAFHFVTQSLLSTDELNSLYKEARRTYGISDELEVEERMAEDFRKFMQGYEDRNFFSNIFRTLKHIIKNLFGKSTMMDNLFQDIRRGRLASRSINQSNISLYNQEQYTKEQQSILDNASRDSEGRLLAPNGKPSNLNERQYVHVRTKAFKDWFGDWENVETFDIKNVNKSLVDIEEVNKPWKSDNTKTNKTLRIYIKNQHDKGYFELVKDQEFGIYSVHFKTGNADTGETYGSTKEERGILYNELLNALPDGALLSTWGELSEGGIKALNKLGRNLKKVGERQVKDRRGNKISIPIYQKGEGVSKVVDENGEPLVVYHGTANEFSTFKIDFGAYFTSDRNYARNIAELQNSTTVLPVFLNIRNLKETTVPLVKDNIDDIYWEDSFNGKSTPDGIKGHDLVTDEVTYKSKGDEYIVFDSNQVKSAEGNIGDYSTSNNNIYYRKAERTIERNTRQMRIEAQRFLNNFAITMKDVDEFGGQEVLFDALERVINIRNANDISEGTGYAVAFMMQHDDRIENLIKIRHRKAFNDIVNPILDRMKKAGKEYKGKKISLVPNEIKNRWLREIGNDISYELKKLYNVEPIEKKGLLSGIWDVIMNFFKRLTPENRNKLYAIQYTTKYIADSIKLNDMSMIVNGYIKPGTDRQATKIDIEEALRENDFEREIIETMYDEGIALAGSASIALSGSLYRPKENPLHDIDFNAVGYNKANMDDMMKRLYKHHHLTQHINNEFGKETVSYLVMDRPYYTEVFYDEKGNKGERIYDKNTKELLGYTLNSDLILKEGIKGKELDFFIGGNNRPYPNKVVNLNGRPYLIADYRNAFNAKVTWAREKDMWDYNRFIPNTHKSIIDEIDLERQKKLIRNAKIIWGHPAIGKTTYLEQNDDILEWDAEVNPKRNEFIRDQIDPEHKMDIESNEYKELRKTYMGSEWKTHPEYIKFLTDEWENLKQRAYREGKRLFASPAPLLEIGKDDFDLFVNLPENVFLQRNIQRGGDKRGTLGWKKVINERLVDVDQSKIVTTDLYFSEFMKQNYGTETEQSRTIQQYHRQKLDYGNLDSEQRQYLIDRGISREEYEMMTPQEREVLFRCM